MIQLTTKDAEFIFNKARIKRVECKHHERGYLEVDGKRVLSLHYSRGRKSFPGRTSESFRRAMRLSWPELQAFLACSLSYEEFVKRLMDDG